MVDGRRILITGCSSGIGRATALRLARSGHTVYATARNVDDLEELAAAGCRVLPLDVTEESSMSSAVSAALADGPIDVLVNNAGYSQSGALEALPVDRLRRQLETNLIGPVRMCQLVLPAMRSQRRGLIVNVSSMGGVLTFPGGGAYHASKHALEAASDALRFEVAGFGVNVVVVRPGLIRTRFGEATAARMASATGAIPEGPYHRFDEAVAESTRSIYLRGVLARLGAEPEAVATVIDRLIEAKRPPTRVVVTASARVLIAARRLLPDRAWDRFLQTRFPRPS